MTYLVFVACMAMQPDECDTRTVAIYEDVSPMGCMKSAQPTMVNWVDMHPGWEIANWRCTAERDRIVEN